VRRTIRAEWPRAILHTDRERAGVMAGEADWVTAEVDTRRANVARVYDYWLGGTPAAQGAGLTTAAAATVRVRPAAITSIACRPADSTPQKFRKACMVSAYST
jgi:S-adenosyl methyltransferase